MLSLLEQVNINPGIWEMFFFSAQKQSAFVWHDSCIPLSSGLCQPPALWHNIARGGLDHFDRSQNTMLDYYIDDIMLIGPTQEVASILDSLVKCTHSRKWEISSVYIQGPDAQMKFLGLQLSSAR